MKECIRPKSLKLNGVTLFLVKSDYATFKSVNTKIFLDCLILKTNLIHCVYKREPNLSNKLLASLKRKILNLSVRSKT